MLKIIIEGGCVVTVVKDGISMIEDSDYEIEDLDLKKVS